MSELLGRVRDFYVAPAEPAPPAARTRVLAPPPAAAVLGPLRAAPVLAGALAISLTRAGGWPCAVVGLWRAGEPAAISAPARPAARRTAARLREHGLKAQPSGRLVVCILPDDAAQAVAAAERVAGSVRGPMAVALAGPRDEQIDVLLRVQDVIVLASRPGDDPELAVIARESLSALATPVVGCQVAPGPLARAVALAGVSAPASLRSALAPALGAAL